MTDDIVARLRVYGNGLHAESADEITKLRADLAAAREALKPFAAAEIYCGGFETDPDDEIVKWQFAIGDIRRARAALKGDDRE